jgi:hypothetical protein
MPAARSTLEPCPDEKERIQGHRREPTGMGYTDEQIITHSEKAQ